MDIMVIIWLGVLMAFIPTKSSSPRLCMSYYALSEARKIQLHNSSRIAKVLCLSGSFRPPASMAFVLHQITTLGR